MALLKEWYGGYRFSAEGEEVYNSSSIEAFFKNGGTDFKAYGSCSEEMTGIIRKVAGKVKFDLTLDNEDMSMPEYSLKHIDIVQIVKASVYKDNFIILLYKTGCLAIKNAELIGYDYLDTLGYPNKEAAGSLKSIIC